MREKEENFLSASPSCTTIAAARVGGTAPRRKQAASRAAQVLQPPRLLVTSQRHGRFAPLVLDGTHMSRLLRRRNTPGVVLRRSVLFTALLGFSNTTLCQTEAVFKHPKLLLLLLGRCLDLKCSVPCLGLCVL